MERVKHIFDVPNMVFVFGINRDELCKSLKSVYGEIDADVYLRRFFDMEFSLPSTDTVQFCRNMMRKYGLEEGFRSLDESANYRMTSAEYNRLSQGFPGLCARFDLSLRDIDYCVRLIALTARSLSEGQQMFPLLLGLLIPLKLKSPSLYRQFIQGERRASDVMNYVDELNTSQTSEREIDRWLDGTEAYMYFVEEPKHNLAGDSTAVEQQLSLMVQGKDLTHPELLSNRTKASGSEKATYLLKTIDSERASGIGRGVLSFFDGLIDLQKTFRLMLRSQGIKANWIQLTQSLESLLQS